MGADDIGLDLPVELKELVVHFLKPREIAWQGTEAIAEKTLDIALAVEFVMTPAVSMRQTDPVYSVAFGKKRIVLRCEEARHPAQWPGLHLLDGFVECLFDSAIQNPRILEGHIQCLMSHKLLQGRFADSVIEQRDGESVPEAVRSQSIDPQFTAQITNNGADVPAALPGSAIACEKIIVGAFPSVFLPRLQNSQTLRSEGNNAVFETLPFPDVELPLVLESPPLSHPTSSLRS